MSRKVFISYRRNATKYQARQIYTALREVMPPDDVFMDIDTIPLGADFRATLKSWVDECDIMLALIDPSWAEVVESKTGKRRLDNANDFVRIEIGAALGRGIPVVPIMLDKAELPEAATLPPDLQNLVDRQAEFIEFRTFDHDVARLITRLELDVRKSGADPVPASPARPKANDPKPVRAAEADTLPEAEKPIVVPDIDRGAERQAKAAEKRFGRHAIERSGEPAAAEAASLMYPPAAPAAGRTGRGATITALVVACLALPFAIVLTIWGADNNWELVGNLGSYDRGPASGSLVAALILGALFVVQYLRGVSGAAIAFYWLALAPAVMLTAPIVANAQNWSGGEYPDWESNNLQGTLVGLVPVALGAIAIVARDGWPKPPVFAVFWIGAMGTLVALLISLFAAAGVDLIGSNSGPGGPLTGLLIGVIAAFATGAILVQRRRRDAEAGELGIYFLGGVAAALGASFPIYAIIFPGYGTGDSDTYTVIALLVSALIAAGWGLWLRQVYRARRQV